MCWMCDPEAKGLAANGYLADRMGISFGHLMDIQNAVAAGFILTENQSAGGAGGAVSPFVLLEGGIGDDVPDGITTNNPVLVVGAPSTISTINENGDRDFFAVTLEAGRTYEFGQYSKAGGPTLLPLADAFLELYGPDGELIVSADGGADTPINDVNSGFDVLLVFTPKVSGTFHVNAQAFDNFGSEEGDPRGGQGVGDYEVFVREQVPDPNAYRPYYDVELSPLHAIDWGTQINKVHQSARNPDGNEGPRDTGNAQGTPRPYDGPNQAPSTGNPGGFPNAPDGVYDDPLVDSDGDGSTTGDGNVLKYTVPGKNVVTVYYARAGEEYKFDDPTAPGLTEVIPAKGFETFELVSLRNSLAAYSDVADIVYVELAEAYVPFDAVNPNTGQRAYADLTIVLYNGTPGTGLLGRHSPPDEGNEGQGEYNALGPGWNAQGLAPGGFSFVTLIHELGHAHGLAHPHDNGGRSSILRGVESEGVAFDYTTGDFDLNQAIHTVMSYEDGWPMSPYGNASTRAGFGYQTGLSAFDIAVIQDKYGVNEEFRTGNDVYVLPEANAVATFNPDGTLLSRATGYSTIWDAGGVDEIRYDGARNAVIDLRAATLRYEVGGGGRVSYTTGADPVFAGFTIANGVTIENATTGSGADRLIGNSANNRFEGNAGDDFFDFATGGDDVGRGGEGVDGFFFGTALNAADDVDGGAGDDQLAVQGNFGALTLGALNLVNVETLALLSARDLRFGGGSQDAAVLFDYAITTVDANAPAGGRLTVNWGQLQAGEDVVFDGSAESDGGFLTFAGKGNDVIVGGRNADAFFFGEDGRFTAADRINGGDGDDQLGLRGSVTAVFQDLTIQNVETIALLSAADVRFASGGSSFGYDITIANGNTAAGRQLTINGSQLASDETIRFNGTNETDGTLRIFAGRGNDVLIGGAGADSIYGNLGGDRIEGGLGGDTFQYRSAAESTGTGYDTLVGFDYRVDRIDLPGSVSGFAGNGRVEGGSLSNGTLDADLDAALDTVLGAGQAVVFAPTSGDLAGSIFAVVDGNGVAGYQVGEDFVFRIESPVVPLEPTTTFFV